MSAVRSADYGRPGDGDGNPLCALGVLPDRQRAAAGTEKDGALHQPDGAGAGAAVWRCCPVEAGGGVPGAAILWAGHPPAEA